MLTFVNNDSGQTVSWSVGQPRPSINTNGNFSCAADSAERKFIKDNFTGGKAATALAGRRPVLRARPQRAPES